MNVTTKATEYQGNATLEFSNGTGRPFSVGAYKLRVVLTALPDVIAWLESNGHDIPEQARKQAPALPRGFCKACGYRHPNGTPHASNPLPGSTLHASQSETPSASNASASQETPQSKASTSIDALAKRIALLEASESKTIADAGLASRVEALETQMAVIIDELVKASAPPAPPADEPGVRNMMID